MVYCKCHNTLTLRQGIKATWDEVIEFVNEPSMDELSDIFYCLNRLAGTLSNKPYRKVFPVDQRHKDKVISRMAAYQCIRSPRHLVNGKCPSLHLSGD